MGERVTSKKAAMKMPDLTSQDNEYEWLKK
jgi:hypothetical protein